MSANRLAECDICQILEQVQPGYVFEDRHWRVSLATDQLYLGRAYIAAQDHVGSIANIDPLVWTDLHTVITRYDRAVKRAFGAQLLTVAILMNNAFQHDPPLPHVHCHARPRYRQAVEFGGETFTDSRFGHHHFLTRECQRVVSAEFLDKIADTIRRNFF